MIHHHPGDELVLALAAGRLQAAQALVVSVHLEVCRECRARLHTLQAVGGVLVDEAEPVALAPQTWARVLAQIDSPAHDRPVRTPPSPTFEMPEAPGGLPWPAGLRGCSASRWHWMGPGMRFSRIRLPHDPAASLFLLRIGEGRALPRHTHSGIELTQVLCGSFDDGRSVFGPGDFDAADAEVHHQPVVGADGECICLAYVGGRLNFDGRIASMIGAMIGM